MNVARLAVAAAGVLALFSSECGEEPERRSPEKRASRQASLVGAARLVSGRYRAIQGPEVFTASGENLFSVWVKMNRTLPAGSSLRVEGLANDPLTAEPLPPGGRNTSRCYSTSIDNSLSSSRTLTEHNRVGDVVKVTIHVKGQSSTMSAQVRTLSDPHAILNPDGTKVGDLPFLRRLRCARARTVDRARARWKRCLRGKTTEGERRKCAEEFFRSAVLTG